MSSPIGLRTLTLFAALCASSVAALVHCAAPPEEEQDLSEDHVTGVSNALGLGLRYDETKGTVQATLRDRLADGEQLYIRVRRGKITGASQRELDCKDLTQTTPVTIGRREPGGKLVYQGPAVDSSIIDLVHLYDDPRWATGDVPRALQDEVRKLGSDPIVEACILRGDKVRAKLQTNLVYAWDVATRDRAAASSMAARTLQPMGVDAAIVAHDDAGTVPDSGGGGGVTREPLSEANVHSQIEYGQLCEKELGEIPFFRKLGDGKYDTFDCRKGVGSNASGSTGAIDGVEGAMIPVHVDGVEQTKCSPGRELGPESSSYGCMDKADRGMFLASGDVQPGPMVHTARNAQGTHWVLLCRKVADDGKGMIGSETFNDIAMLGHNPRTGRTCFFQNSIGSGKDGAHVAHPGDVEKSTTIWSSSVQAYCSGSCHAADPFVHTPWIDGAKRTNGTTVVPKMGEHPDFPVSQTDAPYNIVAADQLGFDIPKQLVSDEVGPCNNCHRLAGNTMRQFARWVTGTGDDYFEKLTDLGKKFENSHWMPPRLEGLTEATWPGSKFAKALEVMDKCAKDANDPACIWADVPRGAFVNPKVSP